MALSTNGASASSAAPSGPRADQREPGERGEPREERDQHGRAQLRALVRRERQHHLNPGRRRVCELTGQAAERRARRGPVAGGEPRGDERRRCEREQSDRRPARRATSAGAVARTAIAASLGVESAGVCRSRACSSPNAPASTKSSARHAKRAVGPGRRGRGERGLGLGTPQLLHAHARRAQRRERVCVARHRRVEARRVDGDDSEPPCADGAEDIAGPARDHLDALGREPREQLARRPLAARPRTSSNRRTAVRSLALAGSPSAPATTSRTRLASACACATRAPAAASASSKLESGGAADLGRATRIEDDRELVARGIVQLLDHQAAAMRRRGQCTPRSDSPG